MRWFWFDVKKRAVEMTPELKADPQTLRLADVISTGLADTAWERLHNWFWAAKIEAIEMAEISEIDIANLPNADDRHMIPFVEVFPLGISLNFSFEKGVWAADEAYCVQPKCDCKDTVLSFLQLKDADGNKAESLSKVPALRYNYSSQATYELARGHGAPATRNLLAALKAAYPSLNGKLELHHRMMQSLYGRHYLARAKSQLQPGLDAALPARSEKFGRNDPCPCGSGKKFKKCCGT